MTIPEFEIAPYAEDDALVAATRSDGFARVRVARPDRVRVVLGRGSRADVELHLDTCRADRVEIARRPGGGCAVVLDPGNLTVAIALPVSGIGDNPRWFADITAWMIAALADAGVPGVTTDGISDLVIGGRKIGGSCIHRASGVLHYAASLLVSPDVDRLERYLRHPPREPKYRALRAHRDFVGSIGAALGHAIGADFAAALERALRERVAERFTVAP
ncbi:MAG: hypothetical protein KJ042_14650 [Deltaproteobacteria bacterium]|nr:hypothetical protein [Deltaproteobacteria bacterium]